VKRLAAALTLAPLLLPLAACSGGGASAAPDDLLVVVSAPMSSQPWVAEFAERGARLAADQLNSGGGVQVGPERTQVRIQVLDNGGEPQRAVSAARTAVADRAVALITDGTGAGAVAAVTGPASLPVFVVYEGGASAIDPQNRPGVFRMAPSNRPMARHLADYLSDRSPRVGLLVDDSTYGRDGLAALRDGFGRNRIPITGEQTVPAGAADVSAQVLALRASGADTLVVWARGSIVAAAITAARESGWNPAIFTSPSGEDPLIRRQLAAHPEWLDGVTFVSWRITSEQGPAPYQAWRAAYEKRFGVERLGVGGVVLPPTWAMYPYDSVRLVAASLTAAGNAGAPLLASLDRTVVPGANGDQRGFTDGNREGVSPDDMCFERFEGFRFRPVADDPLVGALPYVDQG